MNYSINHAPRAPTVVSSCNVFDSTKLKPPSLSDAGVTIGPNDVLCGRGKTSFNHIGNRRFRDKIAANTKKYNDASTRLEKSLVVHSIYESVRDIGGRFLKQNRHSGSWYQLDERQSKEKVGHAIRDATSSVVSGDKKRKRTSSPTSVKKQVQVDPVLSGMLRRAAGNPSETISMLENFEPIPVDFRDVGVEIHEMPAFDEEFFLTRIAAFFTPESKVALV